MKKTFMFMKTLLVAAGLLVGGSAWADVTQLFTQNFESYIAGTNTPTDAGWTITGGTGSIEHSSDVSIGNYAKFVPNSTSGNRGQSFGFSSDNVSSAANCWRVEFDAALTPGKDRTETSVAVTGASTGNITTNNAASGALYFLCKQSANNSNVYNVYLGSASDDASASYTLNSGTFYHFIINYDGSKVSAKIGDNAYVSKTASSSTIGAIKGLKTCESRSAGIVCIDNISLSSLIAPAFTLAENSKTLPVNGTETVSITDITGEIGVSSNNTSVATASYVDGTITINGHSSGVATITVTGTNDGLILEKTIEVTVGEVATTTVTVNYLCGDDPIAEPLTLTDVTVGSVLTTTEVTYSDVMYGEGCRYVNPVLSETLPYVVEENGVINISYTRQAAVTSVNVNAMINSSSYFMQEITLDGKYVGDNITVPFSRHYLLDGTLYQSSAISSEFRKTVTLEENEQAINIDYVGSGNTNVVYFSEGENISGATATSAGSNMTVRSSNAACGYTTSDITLATLEAGVYKATIVSYSNSSAGSTLHFSFGENTYDPRVAGASNWSTFEKYFAFSDNADVKWLTSGDSKNGLDFIYIQRVGDYYESMSIVGDFSENAWEPDGGIEMTRDEDNPTIWTAVVEDYIITSSKYSYNYKATANGTWGVYELGKDDDNTKNQTYNFDYDGAREGKYTLTFTVNTLTHRVSLAVEKRPTATIYFVNTGDWDADKIKVYVWNDTWNNGWNTEGMTATGEQIDGKDVYSWSNYTLNVPTMIIISENGDDNKRTGDQPFVNGKTNKADGSLVTVAKHISSVGYATYYSPYALDFAGTGLTAYIAKEGEGKNVVFDEVTTIPANTGVLLKGDEGDYNIFVVPSCTTDVTANIFEGVTEATAKDAGIFVLMASPEVGFYKTTKTFTVGANTAYIPADAVEGRSFIAIDDENTTSISNVNVNLNDNMVYNLRGQRVAQPTKGLYIVNGKKVVIK